jgi:hypothetical protein
MTCGFKFDSKTKAYVVVSEKAGQVKGNLQEGGRDEAVPPILR